MSKKYLVYGLASLILLAVIVPAAFALDGDKNPADTIKAAPAPVGATVTITDTAKENPVKNTPDPQKVTNSNWGNGMMGGSNGGYGMMGGYNQDGNSFGMMGGGMMGGSNGGYGMMMGGFPNSNE